MTVIPTRLDITVCSPMLIAGSSAGGTFADIDVTTDHDGLPFIPRSRLTARLRDSALAVHAAFPDMLEPAVDLLGRPGAHGTRRLVAVSDAHLPDMVRAAAAHTAAGRTDTDRLLAAITGALTSVEFNTALDRRGAPQRATLRSTRVVNPAVTFTAALSWSAPPSPAHLVCLARMVLGIKQAGMRAGRGRGHVDSCLDGDHTATVESAELPGQENS